MLDTVKIRLGAVLREGVPSHRDIGGGRGQVECGEAPHQSLEGDLELEPSEVLAEAHVSSVSERKVAGRRIAERVEPIEIRELFRISAGLSGEKSDGLTGLDHDSLDLDVL
jgi:hypothetical protein